ncbi:MAG: ammonium transporter [Cyanobacteria bacterium P01_C01_bin.73]
MDHTLIDLLWVLFSASLVFLMQAGFLGLEAGLTRSKNNINVVVKNIADLGVSVLCFWLFGFALMFGVSQAGWLGIDSFMPDFGDNEVWWVVFFLFQAMFCSTAVTIVSGAVAERMRFNSYVAVSILVSGIIYPVYGHWAWNGLDRGEALGWLGYSGFVDFAGSTVVHSVGGWVALATVIVVGPRIGRFSAKRRNQQFSGYDQPLALLGVLLLWMGWFGFNGGSVLAFNNQVPGIIVNTVLAGAAGLVTPIALYMPQHKQVPVSAVMNGSLAGLVAITANCHVVTAPVAIVIGAVGSAVMMLAERWLAKLRIDDVVGAIPVHLAAGIWGTLAVALFGNLELIGTGLSRAAQMRVQLLGVATAGVWAFGVAYLVLIGINRFWPMRVTRKQEHIGLNISEHGASSDLVDLFTTMRRHAHTSNLSLRVPAEPFTPVGQIAMRYNRVINALEDATAHNQAIVSSAAEAIITVTQDALTIRTANPAVKNLFGVSEAAIAGRSITDLIIGLPSGTSRPAAIPGQDIRNLLVRASLERQPQEMQGYRQGRGAFPIEATVTETQTPQEMLYTLVVRDISLRKQAEAAILEAEVKGRKSRELEKALRELQDAQAKLVHSEKMSSLGQLVAGVAHEINNPVNFIHGNLTYAEQYVHDLLQVIEAYQSEYPEHSQNIERLLNDLDFDYLQEDLQKLMQSMRGGTERITEIVKSLKDFSRLGGAELKTVDIHEGIESTLTILGSRIKETVHRSEVRLVKNYGNLPLVKCYASRLNQVFMNLIVNAIDAIDEKADSRASILWVPQLTLATELGRDGETVLVRISDNGVGIPEEVQRRMLDPFFTTKPVGKGTGLGMSITYQIITEHHGGELKCISTPGRGTQFLIRIPLSQQEPPDPLAEQSTEPGSKIEKEG